MQAYCVKCRAKKDMSNAKSITMKNGKPATQGVCRPAARKCSESVKNKTDTINGFINIKN